MWCSRARVASTPTSWVAGDSGAARASLRRPPRTSRSSASAAGEIAEPGPAGAAQHATLVEVEGHQRDVRVRAAAAHAGVELGPQALGGEQLPVERRHDERRRALGDRAQHADQHPVERRVRLTLERQLVDGLEHGHALRGPVEVGQQRRQRLDRLGLADDVELPPPVQQQADVAHRLEPGAELRHRLAHPLGHGPHLAVLGGQQHDDAVGLAELVGAQHHAGVAVQVRRSRRSSPPKRRRRPWKSSIAASRCSRSSSPNGDGDEDQLAVGQLPHERWRQAVGGPEHEHQVRLDVGRLVQRRRPPTSRRRGPRPARAASPRRTAPAHRSPGRRSPCTGRRRPAGGGD